MKKMMGISKLNLILALLVFCMIAGPACAAALEDHDNTAISVGNDNGTYLVTGTAYQLNLEADMADLHIASDPSGTGDITQVNTTSGTFYITCTNESRVFDDTVLMLAVNGTIGDDFSVAITSSGYRWAGPAENSTLPEFGNLTYASSALSETFEKADLSYGPQTWKPSDSADSPIYTSQNMSDTEDTFSLVFIDLNAGVLCNATNLTSIDDLTDRGAVKIEYTFENLQSFAVFNAYGLTNTTSAEIVTTNDVSGSLYSVLIEQEPVLDNITVAPSTASVEINATANFTATAYDTGGSEMSGITFNWSVSDEAIGNVTSEGMFTGISAGTVNVTASCGNVSGYAVVTVSEAVVPTPTPTPEPTPAPETYGGVIPAVDDVYLKVANDYGARFDDFGNDTFHIKWTGGGMNAIKVSTTSEVADAAEVTTTDMTGTFYVVEDGGRAYHDNIYLCVAVNGTIPDDFRIHIIANGYQWIPNATPHTGPVQEEVECISPTLNEWFDKDDFIYGPQTWKPASNQQYPIFTGQDVTDTSNTFMLMFVDLQSGIYYQSHTWDPNTYYSLEVQYEIENLNSLAAFSAYAYTKRDVTAGIYYYNTTTWVNPVGGSGWYVSGAPLPDAASVVIDPVSAEVPVNGKQQFTATAYDGEGSEISGAPIAWSSSATGVGTIDADGLFTPVSEGSTVITATADSGIFQTASVTVTEAVEKVLTTITLDPDGVIMYTDQIENKTFTATGYDQFNDEIPAVYTWSSTVPVVGSIDQTGFFTGKTEGTTVVSATNGSVSETATVEIKQHPDWDVTLIGGINRTLNRTDILDLASSGTISYMDNKGYFWEGVNLTSVLALFDDNDPSTFNTTLADLDYNITIKGQSSGNEKTVLITSLELVDTDKTFITAYILDGYEIPETPVSGRTYWPLKLTGSAIANFGRNIEEITNITIDFPPDVRRIGITSDSLITFAGGSAIQFAATAYDSADLELEHIPFTWSVSDSSIGTVSSNGLFTPIKAGTVNVTATYKLVSESVAVTVLDDTGAMTWTVDQGGNGDFTTIQGAIDYARDGDTILVRDGLYEEKVTIDKELTLVSENGYNSVEIYHSHIDEFAVTSTADNVRISGFNITGYPSASTAYLGGLQISGDNCVVSDNLFTTVRSIKVAAMDNSTIENNLFINYGYLEVEGTTNNLALQNNVFDTSSAFPVKFSGAGSDIVIFNNSITSTHSSAGNGLSLYGVYDNVTVSDNQIYALFGIMISSSENSDINSAKIQDNIVQSTYYSVQLYKDGEDIEISGNRLCSAEQYSIYIRSNPGFISVHDNEILNSAGYSLYVRGPLENVEVYHNEISAGGTYVTYLRDCGDNLNLYVNNISIGSSNTGGLLRYSLTTLNSTKRYSYVYKGETYTDFIGNLYSTYDGTDSNGNGFGDTPFTEDGVSDYSPLVSPVSDYLILEATSINISSPAETLNVGESMDFTASAIDQRDLDFPEAAIVFSSSNPAIGTIEPATGHFEALSHGTVTITASCDDAATSKVITVNKAVKKEVTTNFEVTNCTINGDGNGGGSVSVDSGSATVAGNSISMQGSGFNLTIKTQAAPVVNGGNIEGDIENIVLDTNPVKADLQGAGNVSASVSLDLTGLHAGAGITTTITQDVDADSQSAFQLAASEEGLNVNAVAYTMNIAKTNLANGADIKDATISMAVSHVWVEAHGGSDAMKIIRFAEDGTKEVLDTVYVGSEGDMDLFEAYSPHGLSIFGLAATVTPPESSPATISSSSPPSGGKSEVAIGYAENILAGETVYLTFDESAVTRIDVNAAAEIPELMMTVEEVSKPYGAEDAPAEVYQYVEVVSYRAPEDSIEMATLHFDVEKDWLDSISSSPSDVSVYRYDVDSEEWVLISTVSDGSDVYAYNFFADTGEFGVFAITAKEGTATDSSGPSADSGPSGMQESSGSESTTETGQGIPLPYLILATGLIIGIPAAGYGWFRMKNK